MDFGIPLVIDNIFSNKSISPLFGLHIKKLMTLISLSVLSLLRRGLFRIFPVRWGMGKGENKARGSWEEGKRKRARKGGGGGGLLSPFSRRFPTEGASAEERSLC